MILYSKAKRVREEAAKAYFKVR